MEPCTVCSQAGLPHTSTDPAWSTSYLGEVMSGHLKPYGARREFQMNLHISNVYNTIVHHGEQRSAYLTYSTMPGKGMSPAQGVSDFARVQQHPTLDAITAEVRASIEHQPTMFSITILMVSHLNNNSLPYSASPQVWHSRRAVLPASRAAL